MSLSKKTFALFLLLGISFCLGSYVALKSEILPAFESFERESSEKALARITRMFESDLRALEIMNVEYSLWDPTYAYANGQPSEYAEDNLDPAYWHSINIHLMMIFDAQGNELYSYFSNAAEGENLAFREQINFELEPGLPLISHKSISSSLKGLIDTRSGILQVVSYPILKSNAEGPIAGTLVVGQLLTPSRLEDIGIRATTQLSLYPFSAADMPAQVGAAAGRLVDFKNETQVVTDADSVRGYQVLVDIFDEPIAILEVAAPRRITEIGRESIRTTMIALILGSSIFLLTALVFLQKSITAPIAKLTRHILEMKESGDLNVEIGSDRSDEVGVLANEFGQLTRKLGDAQVDLEAARDEALAMSNAKSDFLARMSHEIRTPMNGVLGMTELLQDTPLDDRQKRFAKTIYESGESLLHIINDILDISKIEAGKIVLDIAPFNLQSTAEECLDLLAESAHNKGLELICDIPVNTHVHVRGDPVRLRQVLMNLVGNAVKFTEQGQVIVRLKKLDAGTGKAHYRFEVEDTGAGINPENAQLIFEPFTQEDGSFTRRYGGTGLGLSICKQLVELMGGEIGVRSTPGVGSTFWFTTDLEVDEAPSLANKSRLLLGKSVLIVDDNDTNLEILTLRLQGWGMQVQAASSGAAALEILGDSTGPGSPFDILLLDMAMPGMDGLQLAHATRRISTYASVPMVMLSSISRANVVHEESTAGPDDWLAKPVRQARLHDTLLSLLGRAALDQGKSSKDVAKDECVANDSLPGLHVLLVDDNDINLIVAQEMLGALGHRVVAAASGIEAVAAVKKHNFDVVLMDCRMPGMDGFEATSAIRELESQWQHDPTPIIALTAHALQGDRECCLAAGMDDYLSKPFTKQQLCAVIEASAQGGPPISAHQESEDIQVAAAGVAANDSKRRVLVVEDNDVNRQVAQAMLQSLGYESETVADGDAAVVATQKDHFDLILMDCHMPGRDGYDATIEIRRRESQTSQSSRTPIVALTADFLESNRQRCLDAGMDDYVTKPFTQAELQVILDRWLSDDDEKNATVLEISSDGFSELGDTISLDSINTLALDEIRQLDPSPDSLVLRDIVVSYCASSSKLMLQLRAAVAERDTQLVEDLAHCLKGGSGQLGAMLLARICDDLIVSAQHNEMKQMDAHFERAAIEHCAVLAGLDKTLQNLAA